MKRSAENAVSIAPDPLTSPVIWLIGYHRLPPQTPIKHVPLISIQR